VSVKAKPVTDGARRNVARPLHELSPAVRRRIENYLKKHPGASRAEARGHAPKEGKKEHVRRREAERARTAETGGKTKRGEFAGELFWTDSQWKTAKKYFKEQIAKTGNEDIEWEDYKLEIRRKGYRWFEQVRARQRALQKRGRGTLGGVLSGKAPDNNVGMRNLHADAASLEAEAWMLYYH